MNSRRKLPWKWWTQYHIKSTKTTNDNVELEWLKAVKTKRNNNNFELYWNMRDIFRSLSPKTLVVHLRLSPSRLRSTVCCIITCTMLSCTSLSLRKINYRFPRYWWSSLIISGVHHTYSFIPWGSDTFYHGVGPDHKAENNHRKSEACRTDAGSRQSWLGKMFELQWCFQKRLNEDMANKQASLICNCSSANKKKSSLHSQGWFECGNCSVWGRGLK